MDHFAGLDVSVKETSVCIVDDTGKIVREVKVASASLSLGVLSPAGSRRAALFAIGRSRRRAGSILAETENISSGSFAIRPS